jgi:hypothetical protein
VSQAKKAKQKVLWKNERLGMSSLRLKIYHNVINDSNNMHKTCVNHGKINTKKYNNPKH